MKPRNRNRGWRASIVLAGGVGGYTVGFLRSLLQTPSFHEAASFAGHTFLAGMLAGAAARLGFSVLANQGLVFRYAATSAAAMAVFSVGEAWSAHWFPPGSAAPQQFPLELILKHAVCGALGGTAGGFLLGRIVACRAKPGNGGA